MSYTNIQDRGSRFGGEYVVGLYRYRHLALNLVGSSIRARFRRSRLGILWAILQPLGFSLIIAAVWGVVFREHSYLSYAVYVLSGMIIWEVVLNSATLSLDSLINSQGYLRQARIPFVIFQLRVPMTSVVMLAFGFIGLLALMAATNQLPPIGLPLLQLPIFVALLFMFVAPMGIIFSILGANFRDARYIVTLVFQALFFLSPVMLGRRVLEQPGMEFMQYVNPMVPILDLFRGIVVDGVYMDRLPILIVLGWTLALWILAFVAGATSGRRLVYAI